MLKKISIGTANFANRYGFKNENKFDLNEITKLKKICNTNNIQKIDTSANYKNAEKIIGNSNLLDFDITTKITIDNFSLISPYQNAKIQLKKSIKKLNIKKNKINLLIHNPISLLTPYGKDFYNCLINMKDEYKINKVGISIYEPDTYINLSNYINIEIVQFPLNIFDNRFVKKNFYNILSSRNVIMQARSVFLQGILLYNLNELPNYFNKWPSVFIKYKKWLMNNKISSLDACINHLKPYHEISSFIFGINNTHQLEQIIISAKKNYKIINFNNSKIDSKLIDPMLWNK